MGVAAPRAPFGGWVRDPLKSSVTGPSLLVICYLEIKFHKKIPIGPPPPPPPPLKKLITFITEIPRIDTLSDVYYVKELGDDLEISCTAAGLPSPQMSWIFEGKNLM